MKKLLLFAIPVMLTTVLIVTAQKIKPLPFDYEKSWETVNKLTNEKQLPESAMKEVEAIIHHASGEKNTSQLIKATIYKMRLTLEKNSSAAPELIKDFEEFSDKITDPVDKSLLQSMIAELYVNYYNSDRWTIDRRAEITGFVPDNVKEWTKNIFIKKISALLDLSLQKASLLQQTKPDKYDVLLEKGKDSESLEPTLFDFLAQRKIELLSNFAESENEFPDEYLAPAERFVILKIDSSLIGETEASILNTYQRLIAFHLQDKSPDAFIYSDLSRMEYIYQKNRNNDLYIQSLNFMADNYKIDPFVVEVLIKQAEYYLFHTADGVSYKRKAYDICLDGINRFPDYGRISRLKNILNEITSKSLNVNHNQTVRQQSELKLNITCTNVSDLQIDVYKVNATTENYVKFKQNTENNDKAYPDRTLQKSYSMHIGFHPDFTPIDTSLTIQSGNYGIYELSITDKAKQLKSTETYFVVSDLAYISRGDRSLLQSVYVLDSKSGLPQKGVKVTTYKNKWNGNGYDLIKNKTFSTDKSGFCLLPYSENYGENILLLEKEKDRYFSSSMNPFFYERNNGKSLSDVKVTFFTDRSLYRPGQTVYFKGIVYYADKEKNETAKSAQIEVTLLDANYQKINSKKFNTNEFGSFAGEFILPSGGLNGVYTLQTTKGSKTIYVEEYKRPTFEVIMDKPKDEIRFGENVQIGGEVKAYAGYQMGGAKVKYRITRIPHRYCWWWNEPEKELTNGTAISDESGKFSVSFIPQKGFDQNFGWRGAYFSYKIYVDVTDAKGETQQAEQMVSVGDKSLFIVPSIPEKIERNAGSQVGIYAETLNGEQQAADIQYSVYKLQESAGYLEDIKDADSLKNQEKVTSGIYNTVSRNLKLDTKSWKPGQYRLVLATKDKWGNEVKTQNTFILFDAKAKRPAVKTYVWMENLKTECIAGEKAHIRFGTSTGNTMVLYEVMKGNKVLESKWIKLNNQIADFKIPFKKEYGAGINVMFTFMKDGKFFHRNVSITRKSELRKLTPTLSVFRNKLLPGEKAEWTVAIPDLKMLKKTAELLVGMYDASLDAIRPHDWNFNPLYNEDVEYSPFWSPNNSGISIGSAYSNISGEEMPDWNFNTINWFGLSLNSYNGTIRIRGVKTVVENDLEVLDFIEPAQEISQVVGYGVLMKDKTHTVAMDTVSDTEGNNSDRVKIRTNFNETAFFYPQLKTDEQGNVKFSFTAPESMTRWNVKMLAHTADLYFGESDTTAVTQKDLMIQMNLPRFVRRSDKLMLSANVANLTDEALSANVKFELIDPATEKPIMLKDQLEKTVSLQAKETKSVTWEIAEFLPFDLVVCKVIARADNFSDGEQKYLPVLPDKVLITESQPLIIRANQTRMFSFEDLIKNASNVDTKSLTLEFSSNPAWYAVQALPTLSTPDEDNAFSLFTAFYVNSLAGYIANSHPKIAKIFDQWKYSEGSRSALLSSLEKNQELKNTLMEETPWVMAAKDESEQKRQIALLFDLNMQKNQAQQYWDKLIKLQMPDGAFSWFAGMSESRYITQEIMLNMARLQKLTKNELFTDYRLPIISAIRYLDQEISKDFVELKKSNKDYLKQNCVGNIQLFYLHVRSEYLQIPIPDFAQEAVKYYTAQSEKYWTSFTLYGKAMMAVVAQRNGNTAIAQDIMKSLKENALKTDEQGMYWAKNTSGYYWNERPVAVQAAIIEAFTEVANNSTDIDELKIWLLKQKQTQCWDSPVSTVNAIYALLLQGSDWLSTDNNVSIKVGEKLIETTSKEAQTGYFKKNIPVNQMNASTGKITVFSVSGINSSQELSGSNIGWGAMYWQYYQDQAKVNDNGSELKITKKLFVKQGNSMIPIENVQVKTGDRIVTRLVINADRNMEYVALKDLRAACFEPTDQRSGCHWKERVCYYQTTKDASTQFFFSFLPKGTYVFEYELWANNAGTYTSGIASIQCQYAPEFVSYAGGETVIVEK
jgi:hypothetical protein